tara:strand:+ start:97 stop:423 length:327 start_codon:yes stop_codon:yes gene_type:complete
MKPYDGSIGAKTNSLLVLAPTIAGFALGASTSMLGAPDNVAGSFFSGGLLVGIAMLVGLRKSKEATVRKQVEAGLACEHCWAEFEEGDERIPYGNNYICTESKEKLGL